DAIGVANRKADAGARPDVADAWLLLEDVEKLFFVLAEYAEHLIAFGVGGPPEQIDLDGVALTAVARIHIDRRRRKAGDRVARPRQHRQRDRLNHDDGKAKSNQPVRHSLSSFDPALN